ncbi:MAG: hypothetical protein IMZ44_06535 [Planctomycetes bacterium]|nr:hypothetical protein [Planctomycetota bacterium]
MRERCAVGVLLAGVGLGLAGAGCATTSLSHDEQVQMLMARDRRGQEELLAAQQRIAQLTASGAQPRAAPAPVEDPFRPAAVRFGKYSGVLDENRPATQQRLRVVIELLDATGDVVKRAGSLNLEALTPPAGSEKVSGTLRLKVPDTFSDHPGAAPPAQAGQPFHRWTFSVDELRQTWLSGLGTYGYILKLPWPAGRAPAGDRLVLRAKFTTLSGEVLTAEAEILLLRPAAAAAEEKKSGPPAARQP